ncbi:MAG: hypothetical protein K2L13_00090 [Opitutales bacterium]|nr:hypothetical protein [Opitutales bacterium]
MLKKLDAHTHPKISTITVSALSDNFTNVLKRSPKMMNGRKNKTIDFIVRLQAYISCLIGNGIIGFNKIDKTMAKINKNGNFFSMKYLMLL